MQESQSRDTLAATTLMSYNFGIVPKHDFTSDVTNIEEMFEDLEFECE